jgi:hypothetical protein
LNPALFKISSVIAGIGPINSAIKQAERALLIIERALWQVSCTNGLFKTRGHDTAPRLRSVAGYIHIDETQNSVPRRVPERYFIDAGTRYRKKLRRENISGRHDSTPIPSYLGPLSKDRGEGISKLIPDC